jgi:hypothetical protein
MDILLSLAIRTQDKTVTVSAITTDPDLQSHIDMFDKQELGRDVMVAVQKQINRLMMPEPGSIIVPR